MTIQELEQALLVTGENEESSVRISSSLNVVKLCGPIVEVIDDYVQFVHFTVKEYAASQFETTKRLRCWLICLRYICNSRMDGFIDNTVATLDLAQRCIWYLCQSHHDAEVLDDEIADNIVSGYYRLHSYAETMWLELVKRYVSLNGSKPLSSELIRALEYLVTHRSNSEFEESTELTDQSYQPELGKFKNEWPSVHTMLCHVVQFRSRCSKSSYHASAGEMRSMPCNLVFS